MSYFFFVVGIFSVLNGAASGGSTVMHQLYSAAYIIGGFVLGGFGAVIANLQATAKATTAQAETAKLMALDLQAIRAAQAASDVAENARYTVMTSHAEVANQWLRQAHSLLSNIEKNTRP